MTSEMIFDKKYIVLIGNYGSGKTEIAIHLAKAFSGTGKTTLVENLQKDYGDHHQNT